MTDLAELLTDEEERGLETLMESYKRGSDQDIAVLTVPALGNESLERYALEVARAWGLGSAERHDGALLLVAREERKIRIEVGRGLEGTLTDVMASRIVRDVIAPPFRRGDFHAGLRRGVEAMHAVAGGDYGVLPPQRGPTRATGLVALVPLLFFLLLFGLLARHSRGLRRRGGGLGGVLPWLLLGSMTSGRGRGGWHRGFHSGGFGGGFGGGGGFSGFGGGGGFSGGGASGGW